MITKRALFVYCLVAIGAFGLFPRHGSGATRTLSASSIPMCSPIQQRLWNSAKQDSLGVLAIDPVGRYIGFKSAGPWGHEWWPKDGYKHVLCGTLSNYEVFNPPSDENDWNLYLIPRGPFQYILSRIYSEEAYDHGVIHRCVGKTVNCLEGEITPDEHFYYNPWFPNKGNKHSPLVGKRICVYGPWVGDGGHYERPEIHPTEMVWWRVRAQGHEDAWHLMLLQDDSNRFDDQWAAWPRVGEFLIPFEVYANGDTGHEYVVTYARGCPRPQHPQGQCVRNVNHSEGRPYLEDHPDAHGDWEHVLAYQGREFVKVFEGFASEKPRTKQSLDRDVGVKFRGICKMDREGSHILGYVAITSAVGHGSRGGEGYIALRVTHDRKRIEPSPPPKLPDLVVSKIDLVPILPPERPGHWQCKVVVYLRNAGNGSLPDSVWTDPRGRRDTNLMLFVNGRRWGGVSIWRLDPSRKLKSPGGMVVYQSSLKVEGRATVKAVVDYGHFVRESSETNNAKTQQVECKGGLPLWEDLKKKVPQVPIPKHLPKEPLEHRPLGRGPVFQALTGHVASGHVDEPRTQPRPAGVTVRSASMVEVPRAHLPLLLKARALKTSLRAASVAARQWPVFDLVLAVAGKGREIESIRYVGEANEERLHWTVRRTTEDRKAEVEIKGVPVAFSPGSSLIIRMRSGEEIRKRIPSIGIDAQVHKKIEFGSIDPSAIEAIARLTGVDKGALDAARDFKLHRLQKITLHLLPTYVPHKNGRLSPEDESPIGEALSTMIKEDRWDEVRNLFGSQKPISTKWELEVVEWPSGRKIPVSFRTASAQDRVCVRLLRKDGIDRKVELLFPNIHNGKVYQVTARVVVRDTFGGSSRREFTVWSHAFAAGSVPKLVQSLQGIASRIAGVSGKQLQADAGRHADAGTPFEPAFQRDARVLMATISHAAQNGRITVTELRRVAKLAKYYSQNKRY